MVHDISDLQTEIGVWASETFDHTYVGLAKHIVEEANDLLRLAEELERASTPEARVRLPLAGQDSPGTIAERMAVECADLGILTLTMMDVLGRDLGNEIVAKHHDNRGKTWVKCADGITRHAGHRLAPKLACPKCGAGPHPIPEGMSPTDAIGCERCGEASFAHEWGMPW